MSERLEVEESLPVNWPKDVPLPSTGEAIEVFNDAEREFREGLRELQKKLPHWDPSFEKIVIGPPVPEDLFDVVIG